MKRKDLSAGNTEFKIKVYRNRVPAKVLKEIVALEKVVFEDSLSRQNLLREMNGKTGMIALIAYKDRVPCGYKLGYEQSSRRFYSWLGGVLPDYRGKGLARALMSKQHELAREAGYKIAVTHTRNEFRDMLLLNIRTGFSIVGVKQNLGERELAIIMEMKL